MKLFLNQIMNSRSTTTGNNNSETTTDDSLSSMQHDYNQYEIVFSSNTRNNNNSRFGSSTGIMNNEYHDDEDDVSALTMPSCIFNNWYYYPFTSMEGTIPSLLTIETELVNTQTENILPTGIGFAPFAMSHNDATINNDDYDCRIIRRSFAFDEDDDEDWILNSPSDGDDFSNKSDQDSNNNHINDKMEDNGASFRVIVPRRVDQSLFSGKHTPYNPPTSIDDKVCITKSDKSPHLSNPLKWKTNLPIRTRRLGRRRKRSYKASI